MKTPVEVEEMFDSAKIRKFLEAAILTTDKNKLKVLIAINSDKDKKMIDDDIQKITGLDKKTVFECIDFLDKSHFIDTTMEDIPGKSPHKMCILTEAGIKVLELFMIE